MPRRPPSTLSIKARAGPLSVSYLRLCTRSQHQKPLRRSTECPFDVFESRWKNFLKSKGLKEIEGSRVRKLRVKKDQREDEETVELKEIQSAVARQRTHLGDQLEGKGRPEAAAREYQRALQASPNSPIILSKLGRVLIQMNRFDEALPPLKKALDVDPIMSIPMCNWAVFTTRTKITRTDGAFSEAVQINPFNPMIYRLLADIYTALGIKTKPNRRRQH